jgi:hypothetical protein
MKTTATPSPKCQTCIDAVLGTLAFHYQEAIDPLLDLKLDTDRKTNPGNCIQTYFWLRDRLPECTREELNQIRAWLESLIEVVAFKKNKELFLRRALKLDVDSLETYCTGMMRHVRRMTVQTPLDLELAFAFRK